MKKKVAVVTTSRADYSHLYWPLREMEAHPEIDLKLIALGPHLSPEFGSTVSEIEKDGFEVAERIECLLSSDSDVGMAKTIGLATLSLADALRRLRPDLLLLIADRYEMLAPASVALALRIPIAHIEGGEISEGAIDDAVRNALTKLSHLHFTSTEAARARVIGMDEEPWRVHCTGAPSIDHLIRSPIWTPERLEEHLGLHLKRPFLLVAIHPVTMQRNTTGEAGAVFAALKNRPEQILFCYPNADAGSRTLIEQTEAFLQNHTNAGLFVNLNPIAYWSLLREAYLLVGNSSSGIMEAASFAVPAVDIGMRQRGRERGRNVLHAEATAEAIQQQIEEALQPAFRASLRGMPNIYGDGTAGKRIADIIGSLHIGSEFLVKRGRTA